METLIKFIEHGPPDSIIETEVLDKLLLNDPEEEKLFYCNRFSQKFAPEFQ